MATMTKQQQREAHIPAMFFGEETPSRSPQNQPKSEVRFSPKRQLEVVGNTHSEDLTNQGRVQDAMAGLDHTPTTATYVAPDLRSITLTGPAFSLPTTTLRVTFATDTPSDTHWNGGTICTRLTPHVWQEIVRQVETAHGRGEFRDDPERYAKFAERFNVLADVMAGVEVTLQP